MTIHLVLSILFAVHLLSGTQKLFGRARKDTRMTKGDEGMGRLGLSSLEKNGIRWAPVKVHKALDDIEKMNRIATFITRPEKQQVKTASGN